MSFGAFAISQSPSGFAVIKMSEIFHQFVTSSLPTTPKIDTYIPSGRDDISSEYLIYRQFRPSLSEPSRLRRKTDLWVMVRSLKGGF